MPKKDVLGVIQRFNIQVNNLTQVSCCKLLKIHKKDVLDNIFVVKYVDFLILFFSGWCWLCSFYPKTVYVSLQN